ncbi:MAG: hypothetical protein V1690_00030 [Candidatus Moraniibacteriota bacterium]
MPATAEKETYEGDPARFSWENKEEEDDNVLTEQPLEAPEPEKKLNEQIVETLVEAEAGRDETPVSAEKIPIRDFEKILPVQEEPRAQAPESVVAETKGVEKPEVSSAEEELKDVIETISQRIFKDWQEYAAGNDSKKKNKIIDDLALYINNISIELNRKWKTNGRESEFLDIYNPTMQAFDTITTRINIVRLGGEINFNNQTEDSDREEKLKSTLVQRLESFIHASPKYKELLVEEFLPKLGEQLKDAKTLEILPAI